ncbi:MAG: alpha-amylase family glycosyl hydrolase [Acidobacteriota bacterium]
MALPRSRYVQEGQEGVYHCFSRCVRRAFLYGFDPLTRRDFSHRKAWLVDRLRYLAAIFAIDVCAYAVMDNHYHTVLRTRPDIAAGWSDREVAVRWLTLFPRHRQRNGVPMLPVEEEICTLEHCPERVAQLRRRLCSLSWFMAKLNEFIARAANKEDAVKGRFWESRFKCQALLDHAAIAACMVYVDLNPIRAGTAATPEESDFTSIQERIRAWHKESMPVPTKAAQNIRSISFSNEMPMPADTGEISSPISKPASPMADSPDAAAHTASWLCPIAPDFQTRGILQMTPAEYFDLVDKSGRLTRSDKPCAIDPDLAPILLRIGANPDAWIETISCFGYKFRLAAGLLANLRNFADQLGRRWLTGLAAARAAFAPSLPRSA